MPPQTNQTDFDIINQVSFNSSDPEDPFPTIIPAIGTMGSLAYPSADLNDPLYVPLGRVLPFLAAYFKPKDRVIDFRYISGLFCDSASCLEQGMLTKTCVETAISTAM